MPGIGPTAVRRTGTPPAGPEVAEMSEQPVPMIASAKIIPIPNRNCILTPRDSRNTKLFEQCVNLFLPAIDEPVESILQGDVASFYSHGNIE